MPVPANDAALTQMIREAYAHHPSVIAEKFGDLAPTHRREFRSIYDTYLRCIAFRLGWVYDHNPAAMRLWSMGLGAIREAFADEAQRNRPIEVAVESLLADLTDLKAVA